jgi:DNA-binding GntR family transcriptional regulator
VSGQDANRKWTGVAGVLRGRIANGTLKPGSRPSIGRLGPELGVARKATARAFRQLEDEGLLERQPGIGYVVLPPG